MFNYYQTYITHSVQTLSIHSAMLLKWTNKIRRYAKYKKKKKNIATQNTHSNWMKILTKKCRKRDDRRPEAYDRIAIE